MVTGFMVLGILKSFDLLFMIPHVCVEERCIFAATRCGTGDCGGSVFRSLLSVSPAMSLYVRILS